MNLFDKLVLAMKSAVGGAVDEVVSKTPPASEKSEDALRMIEKAQARIDLLRADAERAEKRGDVSLAKRLKKEAAGLRQTIDKTRRRAGALKGEEAAVAAIEKAPSQAGEQVAQCADTAAAGDEAQADGARIADLLRGGAPPSAPGQKPKKP